MCNAGQLDTYTHIMHANHPFDYWEACEGMVRAVVSSMIARKCN